MGRYGLEPSAKDGVAGKEVSKVGYPGRYAYAEELLPNDVLDPGVGLGREEVDHGKGRASGLDDVIGAVLASQAGAALGSLEVEATVDVQAGIDVGDGPDAAPR